MASLNVNVNYTDFVNNATYNSNTKFHSGGMKGLYNLTDSFINVIAPDDILMDGKSETIIGFNFYRRHYRVRNKMVVV